MKSGEYGIPDSGAYLRRIRYHNASSAGITPSISTSYKTSMTGKINLNQPNKKMALKVEHFQEGEELEFRIRSEIEILYILRTIAEQNEPVALFFDNDQDFILTSLLEVNEEDIWLDISASPEKNRQLLVSEKITFVSMHQQVKIQFVARGIESGSFENGDAFYLEMPGHILRILRREFFRIPIPADTPVKCIIPARPKSSGKGIIILEVPVTEISGDGVGLVCDEQDDTLLPGKTFRDCQIEIPDFGTLRVTLKVKTNNTFTAPGNVIRKRVGCQLIFLDHRMSQILQRYVIHLQGEQRKAQALLLQRDEDAA